MSRFREIYENTPELPTDQQIVDLCRQDPYSVPVSVIIGQYKGARDGSDEKSLMRKILVELSSEQALTLVESYSI